MNEHFNVYVIGEILLSWKFFPFLSKGLPIKNKQRNKKFPAHIKSAAVDKFQAEGKPSPQCNWILLSCLLLSSGPSI